MKRHVQEVLTRAVVVAPPRPSVIPAAKSAIALGVPLVLVAVGGHLDWAMYAAFGAFGAVFGRYSAYAPRFWQQLSVGLVQVASMLLGTYFSMIHAPFIICALVLGAIGFGANYVSQAAGWMPPGPTFAVFAGGACITIPATSSSFLGVLLVGGGTMLFSLVFMLGLSLRRANLGHTLRAGFTWAPGPRAVSASVHMAVGVLLAGMAAALLGDGHWYWASLGAIAAVTGVDAYARVARGLQRSVGTCVGVLLAASVLVFDPPIWVILVAAIACQVCIELVILRNYALGMVFVTVTALSMVHLVSPEPVASLLVDRVAMTALGAGVGAVQSILIGALASRRCER
ncbi:FUSC family protein [Glutamicibacter sp. JL.03c]|uniref:FUSC family protein n=1 Tax=Glutamicibacter sp. JL.03c TaxID=2984842 RepID=UPI0021F6F0B0|nr:FUSC family protein [Glutamicibacter sp. JL.03c]UYQ77195.1 FUSC family protein [Glutamicibacter sp. JL.03c]